MSLIKKFPTLYQKNKVGKIKAWDISVSDFAEGAEIRIDYGLTGGKVQTTADMITKGKNIGKANETTALQQALAEAESKWTKQQERDGYKEDINSLDVDTRPGIDPMLAHRYDKYPDSISFPCYIQPKLDGHRCIAIIKNDSCSLWSRSRTLITGVPHINAALKKQFGGLADQVILDGELYNHEYKNKFEELASFIRSSIPKAGHEVVQFHVYDMVDYEMPYALREKTLEYLLFCVESPLIQVSTTMVRQDQVTERFKMFRSMGYEGAMLRSIDGKYVGDRSYDLMKVKEFDDSEFKIVNVNEGRGKLKGHAIFECVTEDGVTFEAKLKGDTDHLKTIFENSGDYIGKSLTVQYQGRTKNNIPRFPVGLRVRQDP